jgi:hypothetical protein
MSGERTAEELKIAALAMLDRKLDLTIRNCKAVVERVIELERTVNDFTGSALGPASASDGEMGSVQDRSKTAAEGTRREKTQPGAKIPALISHDPREATTVAPNPSEGGEIETVAARSGAGVSEAFTPPTKEEGA